MITQRSYDDASVSEGRSVDVVWLVVGAVRVAAIAIGWRVVPLVLVVGAWWTGRARGRSGRRWLAVVIAVAAVSGAAQGRRAWNDVRPDELGRWSGWAVVASDPFRLGRAAAVTVGIAGERFDAVAYGAAGRKIEALAAGDYVWLDGTRRSLAPGVARRAAVRHVVGRFEPDLVGDRRPGRPISESANRVRRAIRRAAEQAMTGEEAALFTGLVVGDDGRQSPAMVARFRAVGLSHLTAVSGQNVAYLLAAAAPLLRRLGPRARWASSMALVAWFMALTRFEPSVLRAGVMAMIAATATFSGRSAPAARMLAIAVVLLTAIDPLLVWSVGFWLSVSATAGVTLAAPRIERALRLPAWLAAPLGVTLGAQAGVALPSLLVFGRLPLMALVANPIAVPIAGLVMLVGLPSALLAAATPDAVGAILLRPSRWGTQWVDRVARTAEPLEPPGAVGAVAWVVVIALVALGARRRCASLSVR